MSLSKTESEIAIGVRYSKFYARMAIFSCFNLVEAYFNSLAWDFIQQANRQPLLSNRQKKLLEDASGVSLADKILKYPEIISGQSIFQRDRDPVKAFLHVVKPFRDFIVHPSPFSAPQRFGGYDKLRALYRVDIDTALLAAHCTTELVGCTHRRLTNKSQQHPSWILELVERNYVDRSKKQA